MSFKVRIQKNSWKKISENMMTLTYSNIVIKKRKVVNVKIRLLCQTKARHINIKLLSTCVKT